MINNTTASKVIPFDAQKYNDRVLSEISTTLRLPEGATEADRNLIERLAKARAKNVATDYFGLRGTYQVTPEGWPLDRACAEYAADHAELTAAFAAAGHLLDSSYRQLSDLAEDSSII